MTKFSLGMVLEVTANLKAPDLIGLGVVVEVRENEPQDVGGIRNVYRVNVRGMDCWIREEHLSVPPPAVCSFCGGPTPCIRNN